MITKYFSESLRKYFDSEEECLKAEKEFEEKHALELKKKEERVTEAKAVEEAYRNYLKLRSDFIKKYGSWHMTVTEKDLPTKSIFDFFDFDWF